MEENNFKNLPYDIFEHLCSFLNLYDLQNIMLTCKMWYTNSFNKSVSSKIIIKLYENNYSDLKQTSKIKQLLNSNRYFSAVTFNNLQATSLLKEFLSKFGPHIRKVVITSIDLRNQFEFFSIFEYLYNIRSLELNMSNGVIDLFVDKTERTEDTDYHDTSSDEENEGKFKILLTKEKMESILNIFENLTDLSLYEISSCFGKYFIENFLIRAKKLRSVQLKSFGFSNAIWFYNWLSKHIKTLRTLEITDIRMVDYIYFSYHFENLIKFNELRLETLTYKCDLYSFKHLEQFCQMQCPTLKNLVISFITDFDINLKIICDNLKNLKKLKIDNPLDVQSTENIKCLSQLNQLEYLNIALFDDDQTKEILAVNSIPSLKTLLMSNITDMETYKNLILNFKNLEELHFRAREPIHLMGIQLIFEHLRNLKFFKVLLQVTQLNKANNYVQVPIETNIRISNLKNLEILLIYVEFDVAIPGITINDIAELKNLRELSLPGKDLYNTTYDEYYNLFSKCTTLEVFKINTSTVINDFLVELLTKNCKKLRELSFSDCSELTYKAVDLIVENCQSLKSIEIVNCCQLTKVEEMNRKFKTNHVTTVNIIFD